MNIKTTLFLASLAALTSSLSAASNQTEPELVVLPTYFVEAPRFQPAELRVNASLDELRRQASPAAITSAELPALQAKAVRHEGLAQASREAKATRNVKS